MTKIALVRFDSGRHDRTAFERDRREFLAPLGKEFELLEIVPGAKAQADLQVRRQGEPVEIVHGRPRFILARLQELARFQAARRVLSGRIGVIGKPSDWLIGSGIDRAAVRRRWGTRFVDIGLEELTRRHRGNAEAVAIAREFTSRAQGMSGVDEPALRAAARLVPALRIIFARHRLQAATVRCFSLIEALDTSGCLALSRLNDEGRVCGCEGDMPAAFSMLLIFALTGEVPFLANPAEVDAERNQVVMAHCTVPGRMVTGYRLQPHFETGLGVALCGAFAPGPATVFKVGGPDLESYFVSPAEVLPGRPRPGLCRTQVRLQLQERAGYFLRAPLANHHVVARGDHARRIDDFMRTCGARRILD
ncbi:MAG: fucose isomerase [Acidobacteria bacterium]|nr:fucose isomerase [Acidobacteriota bacterium]